MNMHVITPTDIKEAAIKNYSEMLLNPRSIGHEKYLKNSIKQLQNDNSNSENTVSLNTLLYLGNDVSEVHKGFEKRMERI
jgi:hypothetical protein